MKEYWERRYEEQGRKTIGHISFSQKEFEERSARLCEFVRNIITKKGVFPTGGSILDFGCGWGRLSKVLVEMGFRVYGVDISERAIREAIEYIPEANFQLFDNILIPIENESMDGVLSWTVLQHVPPEEMEGICSEIMRVMRPGARLMAYENTTLAISKAHVWFRSSVEYRGLFSDLIFERSKEVNWVDGPTGEVHTLMVMRKP